MRVCVFLIPLQNIDFFLIQQENNRYKVKKGMKFYRIKIQIPNI